MNETIKKQILRLPADIKSQVLIANRIKDKTIARCELIRIANENKFWGYHAEMSRLIHEEDKINRAKLTKPAPEYKPETLF